MTVTITYLCVRRSLPSFREAAEELLQPVGSAGTWAAQGWHAVRALELLWALSSEWDQVKRALYPFFSVDFPTGFCVAIENQQFCVFLKRLLPATEPLCEWSCTSSSSVCSSNWEQSFCFSTVEWGFITKPVLTAQNHGWHGFLNFPLLLSTVKLRSKSKLI